MTRTLQCTRTATPPSRPTATAPPMRRPCSRATPEDQGRRTRPERQRYRASVAARPRWQPPAGGYAWRTTAPLSRTRIESGTGGVRHASTLTALDERLGDRRVVLHDEQPGTAGR